MCNLHIKETEISNSVLSNKTNLILGFSSPLSCEMLHYIVRHYIKL